MNLAPIVQSTLQEKIALLKNQVAEMEALIEMARDIRREVAEHKLHWTQTPEGKRIMARNARKRRKLKEGK